MPTNIAPKTRQRARRLRREMTPVEGILWSRIKTLRRSHGLHFRRQAPVGPFVVDFACLSRRLVVEVDGASHDGEVAAARDGERDAFLRGEGFTVLRISSADVVRDAEILIDTIIREAQR